MQRATTDPLESQYVQYTYVRKDAHVSASPIVRAHAYVSADQQYELDVNGQRAGKGEAYSFPDEQYYETLDITHLLPRRCGGTRSPSSTRGRARRRGTRRGRRA